MPRSSAARAGTRTRNVFSPGAPEPFKLSRSKLELFLQCPRCFYLDRRLGVGQPSGPPFTLNNAVDALLKREFDQHRVSGKPHELMKEYGIDAVPFQHPELEQWRTNFHGVQVVHRPTNFLFFGAVDDLWVTPDKKIHVVDYKATSTQKDISLDDPWKAAYKRQMEIYQWLLRGTGLSVSNRGYFVFVNADSNRTHFGNALNFKAQVVPYDGDDSWVEDALVAAYECLSHSSAPGSAKGCEWCAYREAASAVERDQTLF